MSRSNKDITVPGTIMNPPGEKMQAGNGTFWNGQDVVANIVGLRNQRGAYMNLIPMGGRYVPQPRKNDLIIGIITDTAPSYWTVDINSPYTAMLHVNDCPWKVDFGETVRYLNNGDVIIAKISEVGELRKVYVSLKEKGLRRLESGHIITMSPSKVPRVIGKKGSMLSMLKAYTNCRIFVGQNGRLWVDGKHENILVLEEAVNRIEAMSHMPGLTTEIEAFLKSRLGEPSGDYREHDDRRGDRRDDRRDRRDDRRDRRDERPREEAKPEPVEEPKEEPVEETDEPAPVEEPAAETVEDTVEEAPAEETTEEPVISIVGADGEPADDISEDIKEESEVKEVIFEEEGD